MDKVARIAAVAGLLAVGTFAYTFGMPTSCVRLPNGLSLGKQALVDLRAPFLRARIVPKFANGDALLPGDAWPLFVTATTVYGTAEATNPKDDFKFVWRQDVGLVRRDANADLYNLILSQAGPLLQGTRDGGFDTSVVMGDLLKTPSFQLQRCRTRWMVW